MSSVSPIRCDIATHSVRINDIFISVLIPDMPEVAKAYQIFDLILTNRLGEAIARVKNIHSKETRLPFIWLISQIIHERVHVFQALATPFGASLARSNLRYVVGLSVILPRIAQRSRILLPLHDNFDTFLLELNNLDPIVELRKFTEFSEDNDKTVSGALESHIAKLRNFGNQNGFSEDEINVRVNNLRISYLNPVNILELWALLIQLFFIKKIFQDDYEELRSKYFKSALDKYDNFARFCQDKFLIDVLSTEPSTLYIVLMALFTSCCFSWDSDPVDRDPGQRLLYPLAGIWEHSNIAHNLTEDLEFSNHLVTQLSTSSSQNSISKDVQLFLECINKKRELIFSHLVVNDKFIDTFLDPTNFVLWVIKEFFPPIVLESNDGLSVELMTLGTKDESFSPLLHYFQSAKSLNKTSQTKLDGNLDWSVAFRFVSIENQNIIDVNNTENNIEAFYKLVGTYIPLATIFRSGLEDTSLLPIDETNLRNLNRNTDFICSFSRLSYLAKEYFWMFPRSRKVVCDGCGEPLSSTCDAVLVRNNGVKALIIEDKHPMYLYDSSYSIAHKKCIRKIINLDFSDASAVTS